MLEITQNYLDFWYVHRPSHGINLLHIPIKDLQIIII